MPLAASALNAAFSILRRLPTEGREAVATALSPSIRLPSARRTSNCSFPTGHTRNPTVSAMLHTTKKMPNVDSGTAHRRTSPSRCAPWMAQRMLKDRSGRSLVRRPVEAPRRSQVPVLCVEAPWQYSSCCDTMINTCRRFLPPSILQEATVRVLRYRPKDHMTCFCSVVQKPFTTSGNEDTRSHSYFTNKKNCQPPADTLLRQTKPHRQVCNHCLAKKLIKRTMAESSLFAVFADTTSSRHPTQRSRGHAWASTVRR